MVRITATILFVVSTVLALSSEAQAKYEIRLFSGMRFGGSITNTGYSDNTHLEDLDVASGPQFGGSFYIVDGARYADAPTLMFELLVNFQSSELRFQPDSLSGIPDSILADYEVDGDKVILGDVNLTYIHVGIVYKFAGNDGWKPHANLGIGATIFRGGDGDLKESKLSFSVGGGLTKMFTDIIGGRLQLTGYLTPLPSDVYWNDHQGGAFRSIGNNYFTQGEISGGIVFAF